jgi:aldose 1-epimerase
MDMNRRGLLAAAIGVAACAKKEDAPKKEESKSVKRQPFGKLADGTPVEMFVFENKNGMRVSVLDYGGTIVSLETPDKSGKLGDVVLGFDNFDDYATKSPYFGCIVGRYANRIAKGKFKLNGVTYKVPVNNGDNALHGGIHGFDKKVWKAEPFERAGERGLTLSYLSKDGEEGYPGNLQATVVYTLTDADEWKIDYSATTDKETVLNLTNHTYYNLSGQPTILEHELLLNSERFTPVDKGLIPTGVLQPVEGTPFDFRKSTAIGARIDDKNEQLKLGGGYDHNWVIAGGGKSLTRAAVAYSPQSGRVLEVLTDQPGVQFYTGNFLDGTLKGKGGVVYGKRSGFCLETQHYPDSPNQPNFPTTVLKPGEKFQSTTVWKFSTR